MNNERGIALIITLLVVTLLTIAVVEFTYSVQVDQQLAHNTLSAMQAAVLARSGVNLGEAMLARDTNQPPADWYFEDWASPDISSVVALQLGQRLAVRVLDESGKININRTRPRSVAVPGAAQPQPTPAQGQPGRQVNLSPDAFLRDALRRLFEANNVDVQIPDRLLDYWGQTPPAPLPGSRQVQATGPEDFRSLEDFGATFGISSKKLSKLSRFLTALPVVNPGLRQAGGGDTGKININTAPVEVLTAVINDGERISRIVERQGQEEPIEGKEMPQFFGGMELNGVAVQAQMMQVFGVSSAFFRIYASAMVNTDPTGVRLTGVGQTAVALVNRRPIPGIAADAPANVPRWTLTLLDWQKRGGAQLLMPPQQGGEGQPTPNEL